VRGSRWHNLTGVAEHLARYPRTLELGSLLGGTDEPRWYVACNYEFAYCAGSIQLSNKQEKRGEGVRFKPQDPCASPLQVATNHLLEIHLSALKVPTTADAVLGFFQGGDLALGGERVLSLAAVTGQLSDQQQPHPSTPVCVGRQLQGFLAGPGVGPQWPVERE